MTIFLPLLYSQCNPYQHPSWLFCNKLQDDPEIHMEIQGPQNGQNYLEKEGFFHYLILRHFKAVVIENAVLCGNRQIGGTEQRLEIDAQM